MKKNIGLLVPSLNNGGAERVVSRLSLILSDEYNVFVVVFEDTYMKYEIGGTLINLGIKAHPNYLMKMTLLFKRANKLKKIKKRYKLHCVISFLDSPNLVNIMSPNGLSKTIISIRNYNYKKKNIVSKKVRKSLYKKADYIVPVSKLIGNNLVTNYGIDPGKVKNIYNPYDIEQIKLLKKEELKLEYKSFFENGFVYISVGRNTYQKGFWHLIKSFKIVHDKYPYAKLVIIGRDETGGKAERLAKELNVEENILFTGPQNNPFSFIGNSDAYVLSSLFEGFPNALVEAMSCGCPVIATDSKSGPREILYDNPNLSDNCMELEKADYGILVPAFDRSENWVSGNLVEEEWKLAEAMLFLLENKRVNDHYSMKSLERAKHFNYDRCKTEFINLIGSS